MAGFWVTLGFLNAHTNHLVMGNNSVNNGCLLDTKHCFCILH